MLYYKLLLVPFYILLSCLYGCIVFIRNMMYDKHWIQVSTFDKPIISIGNITTGGTGKTPLVIYLAQFFQKTGRRAGIISRGYGRKSKGMIVVHDGKNIITDVDNAGDEPYLMACTLQQIPIIVCEDRCNGIQTLIDYYSIDVVLMDDGFQHRKVKRDFDIITISSNDSASNYYLLPLGRLREPLKNIKRAQMVIYTKTDNFLYQPSMSIIEKFYKNALEFSMEKFALMKVHQDGYKKTFPPEESVFAFCGIGEPESFFKSLDKFDIKLGGKRIFKDHQDYTSQIINELSNQVKASSCKSVITTEKDLVKLSNLFIKDFDVYILKIELIINKESYFLEQIQSIF